MGSFKTGDLVAVFGGEICENKKTLKNITVCEVLACGKYDLVVAPTESAYRTGTYSVSKSGCQKLSISKIENVTKRIVKPEIGDLVLSYQKKSFSDEKLINNYNAVIDALEKEKSNLTIKGDLVKELFITSSMGVSYKLKMDKSL